MSKNLRVFLKNRHFKYTTFFQKRKTFFKIFPKVSIFNVLSLFRLLYNRNFFVFSVNGYIFFRFFSKTLSVFKRQMYNRKCHGFSAKFLFFFYFNVLSVFKYTTFSELQKNRLNFLYVERQASGGIYVEVNCCSISLYA